MQSPDKAQAVMELLDTGSVDLIGFDSRPGPRLLFGLDVVDTVGEHSRKLSQSGKVLLVTDPGVEEAGHCVRVEDSLRSSGLDVTLFDEVVENPTTREVTRCVEVATEDPGDRRLQLDCLFYLGALRFRARDFEQAAMMLEPMRPNVSSVKREKNEPKTPPGSVFASKLICINPERATRIKKPPKIRVPKRSKG